MSYAAVAADTGTGTEARAATVQPICPTVSQALQTGAQAAWSVPQWAQRQRGSGRAPAAWRSHLDCAARASALSPCSASSSSASSR